MLFKSLTYLAGTHENFFLLKKIPWVPLTFFSLTSLLISCQDANGFTRNDCQKGSGYNAYLIGYYTGKNSLQKESVNVNKLYRYCYMQGYFDASG